MSSHVYVVCAVVIRGMITQCTRWLIRTSAYLARACITLELKAAESSVCIALRMPVANSTSGVVLTL